MTEQAGAAGGQRGLVAPVRERTRVMFRGLAIGIALMLPAAGTGLARADAASVSETPTASATPDPSRVAVWATTSNMTDAMTPQAPLTFSSQPSGLPLIMVNPSVRYQRVTGFGAAMTDSSAWLLHDGLPAAARATVMRNLFTSQGIHLGFLRVPMAASDFTVQGRPYNYDPGTTPDPTMKRFSIAHDRPYIIPMLREAEQLNPHLFVIATPWSPPAWMKANLSLDDKGHGGRVLASDLPALARYFIDFLRAYRALGVAVDAVTPQNEPNVPTGYPGADLSASEEAQFIAEDLAPALKGAHLATRIYGYDEGWSTSSSPFAQALIHDQARAHLAGIAWHCYFGAPGIMSRFHAEAPGLDQIESECSPGIVPYASSELAIGALRNWATAVAVWNLALNPRGGPVQPPNSGCPNCTGVVTVDERAHSVDYTRDYYELGQFSRFIEPGAVRIGSNTFTAYSYLGRGLGFAGAGVDDVAFGNPDGSDVLVVYNSSTNAAGFDLEFDGRFVSYSLSPGETATFAWNLPLSAFPTPYNMLGPPPPLTRGG